MYPHPGLAHRLHAVGVHTGSENELSAPSTTWHAHPGADSTLLAVGLIRRNWCNQFVLARLGGLAAKRILAILFFIPAMNLAGVPPSAASWARWAVEAGVEDGRVLALILVAGGALTSLLTLYAIVRSATAFLQLALPEITALDGDAGALQTESGRYAHAVRRRVQRDAQRRVTQREGGAFRSAWSAPPAAVVTISLLLTVFAADLRAHRSSRRQPAGSQHLRRRRPGCRAARLDLPRPSRARRRPGRSVPVRISARRRPVASRLVATTQTSTKPGG